MQTAILLALVMFGGFGLVKLTGWIRRRSGHRRLEGAAPLRSSERVDLRITLFRTRGYLGLEAGRAHAARADLLLTAQRFVIASDHGVLADLVVGQAPPLRSARCTGPGRLVLEGDVPQAAGSEGRWRMELVVHDAPGWAEALQPFVVPDPDAPRFGSFPGPLAPREPGR